MACANNPYVTAVCECGQRNPDRFEECFQCGREGCNNCMSYEEDNPDPQTGYRDARWFCGKCSETAPKVAYPQKDWEDELEDCDVNF